MSSSSDRTWDKRLRDVALSHGTFADMIVADSADSLVDLAKLPHAYAISSDAHPSDQLLIFAASPNTTTIVALLVSEQDRNAGLEAGVELATQKPELLVEMTKILSDPFVAEARLGMPRAPGYLLTRPAEFGVVADLPGLLFAVGLHDYEVEFDGHALLSEVRGRAANGITWF